MSRSYLRVLLLLLAPFIAPLFATTTLTNADLRALSDAIAQGGEIRLAFDGSVVLASSFVIRTNTFLDASGSSVTFDGGNSVRHFVVTNGATLRLLNLKLVQGRFQGATGQTNQAGDPGFGGSILCSGGSLELINCSFISNNVAGGLGGTVVSLSGLLSATAGGAAYGGAIYLANSGLNVTNSLFVQNTATGGQAQGSGSAYTGQGGDGFGGAIYGRNSTLALVGVNFTCNSVVGGSEGNGGRICGGGGAAYGGALADASSFVLVSNCTMTANQAAAGARSNYDARSTSGTAYGGAFYHESGQGVVEASWFNDNTALGGIGITHGATPAYSGDGDGGAIFNNAQLTIRNTSLTANAALGAPGTKSFFFPYGGNGSGGAFYNVGQISVVNSTLAGNTATGGSSESAYSTPGTGGSGSGGGLFGGGGDIVLVNVTAAGNAAIKGIGSSPDNDGSARGASIYLASGSLNLTNTILAVASGATNVWGKVTDGGHNLSSDESPVFTSVSSQSNVDPLLAPLGENGGPTPMLALLLGSPAIDRGDDLACPATDQRGVSRPIGPHCDIGAYELVPPPSLRQQPDGKLLVRYICVPNRRWIIDVSTNLLDWSTPTARTSDTNGVISFEDNNPEDSMRRFYRLRPR